MPPPGERLETNDPTRFQVDDRLIFVEKFLAFDSFAQFRHDIEAPMGLLIAVRRIDGAIQFSGFRRIHRNIRLLEQRFSGRAMLGEPRYPNAAGDH